MLGAWGEHAQTFATVFGAVSMVVFSLPLLVAPLAWARVFRWNLPDDTDLAVYFGRCLGASAVVASGLALRAGLHGTALEFIFQFMVAVFTLLTLVHVWGWLRRIQPLTETIEIAFWLGLLLLAILFYPT